MIKFSVDDCVEVLAGIFLPEGQAAREDWQPAKVGYADHDQIVVRMVDGQTRAFKPSDVRKLSAGESRGEPTQPIE